MDLLSEIIKESWALFTQMSLYLVVGLVFAGFIHILLKPETVFRHLGERKFLSVAKAVLFGVPLPLCSCGVIPPAATLYKSGATKGSVIAFLIATPTTGIDSIFATYGLLGGIFTIFRVGVSVIIGMVAGLLTDIFSKQKVPAQEDINKISCSESSIAGAFRYAFIELYGSIAKWLFWGALMGGIIICLIPDDFLSRYLDYRYLTYSVMLVTGIPLYVCATGSIPVAASLIAKGLSPGAGLIFLIAGPATNTVTMLFVYKVLGKRSFFVYIAIMAAGAILSGVLLDALVKNYSIDISDAFQRHRDFSFISYISSFLLAGISLHSFALNIKRRVIARRARNYFVFSIPDISCISCAKKIVNNLQPVEGIKNVEIDVKNKKIRIYSEFDNRPRIKEVLASIGYPVKDD